MASKLMGTVARGLCAPSINAGDDLTGVATRTILAAAAQEGLILHRSDLVGVAGSMLARAQNNTVTVDQLAAEICEKYGENATLGLLWPTYSTSYITAVLRGIARGCKKLVLQLAYPMDESGRSLMTLETLYDLGVDPYEDTLSEGGYLSLFSSSDEQLENYGGEFMEFCRSVAESEGCEIQFLFCNHPDELLKYTRNILYCHGRRSLRMEKKLMGRGVKVLYGLGDLCTAPVNGSGYQPEKGLLGAISDTSGRILLEPREVEAFEEALTENLKKEIGVAPRVQVFHEHADGALRQDAASLCAMLGDSYSSDSPMVLIQGFNNL